MPESPNPEMTSDREPPSDPLDAALAVAFGAEPASAAVLRPSRRELTEDYRGSSAAHGGPARPVTMALVPGPTPHLTSEVQSLLRKRLRVITLVISGLTGLPFLLMSINELPDFIRKGGMPIEEWLWFGWGWVYFITTAVLAGILWSGRPLSLRRLRAMELIVFGCPLLLGAVLEYTEMSTGEVLLRDPGTVAQVKSVHWILLIVAYGVFIPNTWRRCAVCVGFVALLPLSIAAVTGFSSDALPPGWLLSYLLYRSLWLALATAIAAFGSNKISRLQEQAFEARQLGQYRLKERLGAGGMGEVYLAEHVLLRRPCAVKLIRPEKAGDPTTLRRFEREVQTTAKLTHWNTVEIYDYGHTDDGTFYYAMEYLPGLNLEDLVEQYGPLPPERAVHFLRQVCRALREAHAVRLIHRDLKPSNVIVCERGGVPDVTKLLDFGLVQTYGLTRPGQKLTQEGTLAGTPAYMSPEQVADPESLDARSDIYSLGAMAYFLLTRRPPFERKTAIQTMVAHLHEPVRPLTDVRENIPADLEEVVLRCLAKAPGQRFPDAEALEQALARCRCADQWTREKAADWWQRLAAATDGKLRSEVQC